MFSNNPLCETVQLKHNKVSAIGHFVMAELVIQHMYGYLRLLYAVSFRWETKWTELNKQEVIKFRGKFPD